MRVEDRIILPEKRERMESIGNRHGGFFQFSLVYIRVRLEVDGISADSIYDDAVYFLGTVPA